MASCRISTPTGPPVQTFVTRLAEACAGAIAIDGGSKRRPFDKASGNSPLHMVSTWCSERRLILEPLATDTKSDEITAIPGEKIKRKIIEHRRLLHRELAA